MHAITTDDKITMNLKKNGEECMWGIEGKIRKGEILRLQYNLKNEQKRVSPIQALNGSLCVCVCALSFFLLPP